MPKNANHKESHIEAKLNDLSLIEPSDSDDELSAHQKSTVTSSNQNRPFIDDLKFSNTIYSLHDPICQSSILEYPNSDNVNIEQSSKIKTNEKIIETINLIDDSPKTSKLCLPPKHHDLTIDLTDEIKNKKFIPHTVTSKDSVEKNSSSFINKSNIYRQRRSPIMTGIIDLSSDSPPLSSSGYGSFKLLFKIYFYFSINYFTFVSIQMK